MDTQIFIVGGIVAVAIAYLARSAWKTLHGRKIGCGSGCGKCGSHEAAEPGRIALPRV